MSDKYSILVIGDLIIDETWHVHVRRKNPEAPVITAELLSNRPSSLSLGGAGFAAQLAAKEGHNVTLFSTLSPISKKLINNSRLNTANTFLLSEDTDVNITKVRFIDDQQGYHLFRTDNDRLASFSWPQNTLPADLVITKIDKTIREGLSFDACLLSDYSKGFFSGDGWRTLLKFLSDKKIYSVLDSKSLGLYPWRKPQVSHDTWIKLNDNEFDHFRKAFHITKEKPIPEEVFQSTDITDRLLITHGKEGASIYSNDDTECSFDTAIPEIRQERVADPTGCGDAFDIKFLIEKCKGTKSPDALKQAVDYASDFARIPLEAKLL